MAMGKRRLVRLMGAVGALLLIVSAGAVLLLPRLISQQAVMGKILEETARLTEGTLELQSLNLKLFPYPRVVIRQGKLDIPGKARVRLPSLTIAPHLLPLLVGRVEIAELRALQPRVQLLLAVEPQERTAELKAFAPARVHQELLDALSLLAVRMPGVNVKIDGGELDISQGDGHEPLLHYQDIKARIALAAEELKINMECRSGLGEGISASGWLDPRQVRGEARLDLTDFQPHKLTFSLFALTPQEHVDSSVNLHLELTVLDRETLQGTFQGSAPRLKWTPQAQHPDINCERLAGSFELGRDRLQLTVTELDFTFPKLHARGTLVIDRSQPLARLDLEGWEVDAFSVRKTALDLLGDNHTVKDTFTIVQGGRVPWITCNSQAASLSELGNPDNLVIRGAMVGGKILVPGIGLEVDEAQGEVIITEAILYGWDLQGRTRQSTGRNGDLLVGLTGGNIPFHLGIDVDADLVDLHEILQKEIKSRSFHEEMLRIAEIKGRANGRMILGETTKDLTAQVEVRDFNLSSRYQRIPHAVRIDHGRFSYREGRVSMGELDGKVGNSSFNSLTAWVDWEKQPILKVLSMAGRLSLNEAYPWVMSYPRAQEVLKEFTAMEGVLRVDGLDLDGPLAGPDPWSFQLKGGLENAVIKASFLPAQLAVAQSALEATHEKLAFNQCQAKLMDASLDVAGAVHGYLSGVSGVELSGQGTLATQAGHWVYDAVGLPTEFRVRPPLTVAGARGSWQKGGQTRFTGNFTAAKGMQLALEGTSAPGNLTISNLTVKGSAASASMSLALNGKGMDFAYQGKLTKPALDELLESNQILSGSMQGDFRTHLLWNALGGSTAAGKLQVAGLRLAWGIKVPLQVERAILTASGKKLEVDSAMLVVEGNTVELKGNIEASQGLLNLGLEATSRELEWTSLERLWKKADQSGSNPPAPTEKSSSLPLRGAIKVDTDSFKSDGVSLKPAHGTVLFRQQGVGIALNHGGLCGIPLAGEINFAPAGMRLDLHCDVQGQELEPVAACLWERKMTGRFDLSGKLTASGDRDLLANGSRGNLDFIAKDGRIYELTVLNKILAVLNLTEIFRGRLPDLTKDGFAYKSMKITGDIADGHLQLKEAVIDGSSMKLIGQGDVDLIKKELDLTVLVAPLKTADAIFSQIPVLGKIVTGKDGTLLSIPFGVKGELKDPKITALPATAVGSGMLGILKRTLEFPVDVIQPLLPNGRPPAPGEEATPGDPGQGR
jgi:hypothetical protein